MVNNSDARNIHSPTEGIGSTMAAINVDSREENVDYRMLAGPI
jgi:hypothetical protein